jgi:S-formylglutathione hydrolase FrmB
MPDGDDSWYTTFNMLLDAAGCRRMLRPPATFERDCVPWPHYDDYIAFDVVRHVDAKYRTLASRDHRGIAGLSMGGYGAVMFALDYPQTFSAAASHSGTLSPLEFAPGVLHLRLTHTPADSAAMAAFTRRGVEMFRVVFGADSASWLSRDPAATIARLQRAGKPLPPLFADGGMSDPFLAQSRAFRDSMAAHNVPLEYHEWPGGHDWDYWSGHVAQSLSWLAAHIAR